jgi:hypothetical protein
MKMSTALYKKFEEALQNTFTILSTDRRDMKLMFKYKDENLSETRLAFDLFHLTPSPLRKLLWSEAYSEDLHDGHVKTTVLKIFRTRFDYENRTLKVTA